MKFWTENCVLCCADVQRATEWWIEIFGCKQVPVLNDWDDTLPSDVALQLPDEGRPTILLRDPVASQTSL